MAPPSAAFRRLPFLFPPAWDCVSRYCGFLAVLLLPLLPADSVRAEPESAAPAPTSDLAQRWDRLKQLIRTRFADVPRISTTRLQAWLDDPGRPNPILLDVRMPAEFAVSHLRGAHRAVNLDEALRALEQVDAEHPIVTYCSVGYRSAVLGRALRERGFRRIANLEGSLFAWANERRPLFRGSTAVTVVHPYDEKWGRYLKPAHHPAAWKPAPSGPESVGKRPRG